MLYHNGLTLKVDYFTWLLPESVCCAVGPPVHRNPIRLAAQTPVGTWTNPQAYTAAFEGIEMAASLLEGGWAVGAIVQVLVNAFILLLSWFTAAQFFFLFLLKSLTVISSFLLRNVS